MKTFIEDFKTKGFVGVPYPPELRIAVNKAAASWKKFYSLPDEVKKSLPYSNSGTGVGYEKKTGVGPKGDRKENFDVTLAGKAWLEENIKQINNPVALEFVQDATALVMILKPVVVDFAKQVEEIFGLKDFAKDIEESANAFFIRFAHYPEGVKVYEATATPHVDQSTFTPHLFETDRGLQCFTYEGEWLYMPVSEGEMVIIPAMQLQLRSEGELKALCHQVIATEITAVKGRDSAVCFVQAKNTLKYNKEKLGRLQEQDPGFNYHMPQDEFGEMFI